MTPEELRLAFESEIAQLSDDDRIVWMRFTAGGVVQDAITGTVWVEWHWLDSQGELVIWWVERYRNGSIHAGLDRGVGTRTYTDLLTLKEVAALAIHEIRQVFRHVRATQPPAAHQNRHTQSSA